MADTDVNISLDELRRRMNKVLADTVLAGFSPKEVLPDWLTSSLPVAAKASDKVPSATPAEPVVTQAKLLAELSGPERADYKGLRNAEKLLKKHDAEVVAAGENPSLRVRAIAYNALVRYSKKKALVQDKSWFKRLKPEPPKLGKKSLYDKASTLVEEANQAGTETLKLTNGELTGSALKPVVGDAESIVDLETVVQL